MRRRSVSIRIVVVAIVLFFATIALFTKILIPAERIVLDGLGGFLLGVRSFSNTVSGESITHAGAARVVARRADEFQNTFIVYASVPEGSRAVFGGALVGVAIARGSTVSKIEAISAPGFILHGIIDRSGVPLELHGKGAMLLEARLPRGADVRVGDSVVEELVVGTVVDIIDSASDPFVTIIVQSPINIYTLSFVDIQEEAANTP